MTDGTTPNPSSFLLPVGPFAIGAGWSTVLTYPSLQTKWGFWQSPNSEYWGPKAQNKSLLVFAGEAYNVEMGISNELFETEREENAKCQFKPTPNDTTNPDKSGLDVLSAAMAGLAALPNTQACRLATSAP
jgi:hypothetical protein